MARKDYVLDTSALFALIEEEDGAERVEAIMRSENAILPWLVLLEVHYITRQERGPGEADRRYALLKQSPCEVLWQIDETTLLVASRFKAAHRLSFADAVIAAFAFRRDAVLVHKDPEYEALADHVTLEALPYKARTEES
ncbi:MAG TPA: PIN domain-containing protein [Thermoanaerobaculia bacterium]|nr:PIN domain-containing protein [Thermoanaerobaculia bacterium]